MSAKQGYIVFVRREIDPMSNDVSPGQRSTFILIEIIENRVLKVGCFLPEPL
jgi:hypothetical protein